MAKKSTNAFADTERRKQRAFHRLGTDQPECVICGEGDWQCLELHHIAGQAYDDMTVILCRNCHRKQSDPSDNKDTPANASLMERIGQFLLGLAELLIALATKLKEYGEQLLEGASMCPPPWGYSSIGESK